MFYFMILKELQWVLSTVTKSLVKTLLGQVKSIIVNAIDAYHALYTSGKWHVNHKRIRLIVCWNCGDEGHCCEKCGKPQHEPDITVAKKKWHVSSGGNCGTRGVNSNAMNRPSVA